jgi:hypothetical protein
MSKTSKAKALKPIILILSTSTISKSTITTPTPVWVLEKDNHIYGYGFIHWFWYCILPLGIRNIVTRHFSLDWSWSKSYSALLACSFLMPPGLMRRNQAHTYPLIHKSILLIIHIIYNLLQFCFSFSSLITPFPPSTMHSKSSITSVNCTW